MSALVDQLFTEAFHPGSEPKSLEYKKGVKAALASRIDGAKISCHYRLGTAQCDAFLAGVDQGVRIWREKCAPSY